jgi:hypothetical protein
MITKKEILKRLRENVKKIKTFGVKKIGLFGSYLKDKQKESSDIDFIVEFEEDKKTFDNFIELAFFLEEIFKKQVDLLTLESISPYIKPYIEKEIVYAEL